MQLFWTFVGVPVWPRSFLYVPGIWINTLLNLFRVNFLKFVPDNIVLLSNIQNEGKMDRNLNNSYIFFDAL